MAHCPALFKRHVDKFLLCFSVYLFVFRQMKVKILFCLAKQDRVSARRVGSEMPSFSYPVFWRQLVDTAVLISSEACPRWNKAYTSIGLRGTAGYLTGFGKIDKWALFFTGKWQAVPYVRWRHVKACSLSSSPSFFLFFNTSAIQTGLWAFKWSEFCNMAVCPRAVKFGRICFSKWKR